MQTTEKRREKASITPFFLSTTSLIIKNKASQKKQPTTNVDFHLEVVRKIDELLKDPKPQPRPQTPSVPAPQQINRMPPPVEERSPFGRHPGHEEIAFHAPTPTSSLSRPHPIPEEFKTDFPIGMNPAFRFVTSLDSIEDLVLPKRNDNHIEVIDLNSLRSRPSLMKTPEESDDDDIATPHHVHDDLAFLSSMTTETPNTPIDRSELYTLQAKNKTKQDDYIPDLSERIQQIRERQQEEEQRSQHQQTKEQHHHDDEEAELKRQQERKKQQQKKTEQHTEQQQPTEHQHGLFHHTKPQDTTPPDEPDEPANCDTTQTTPPDDEEPDVAITDKLTKRQQKLATKQAKLEEKRQKQHQKLLLKEQRKKDKLKAKASKHQHHKPPKPEKTKHHKTETKDKHSHTTITPQTTPDLDDDLLRFIQLTDTLLGQLPEDVIERFANSEDFQLYEKVMAKYHLK